VSKKTVAEIFSDYRHRLLKFIRSRVSNIEDAEDILQDVFYKLIKANNMVNPIENTAAWLYKVARNRIIDHRKKKKEESLPSYYSEDDDEYIYEEIADFIYGEETTPETEMLRAMLFEDIQAAIAELPKEQREVFEMTELLDFSVKEVSGQTNTPINTVLSRKHYAVKYLRKRLKEISV
jgi:RNA polymerase sigma factor (sigma-70 family)